MALRRAGNKKKTSQQGGVARFLHIHSHTILVACAIILLWWLTTATSSNDWRNVLEQYQTSVEKSFTAEPCAIVFFGLPRSFQSLVYPSILKHVLQPNAKYRCDIFVHYYNLTVEQAGRSGDGGALDPHQVRLLAVPQHNTTVALFDMTQEQDFWMQYKGLLTKMRTVKDTDGNLLYHPWKEKSYHMTQAANVIKMWHSIQEGFRLLERHASQTGISYTRVAVLRSDVFYMTPVDIWETGTPGIWDRHNKIAVVPHFANFPVNDRMIYGPYDAVRIWATARFGTLEEHVQWTLKHKPGYAMHSETFVEGLLDSIQKQGYRVDKHETICFFRARADETLWVNDCSYPPPFTGETVLRNLPADIKDGVEKVLGRACVGDVFQVAPESRAEALHCPLSGIPKMDD